MDDVITIFINRSHIPLNLSKECIKKYNELGGEKFKVLSNSLKDRSNKLLIQAIVETDDESTKSIRFIYIPKYIFNCKYIYIKDNCGLEWPFLNFDKYKLDLISNSVKNSDPHSKIIDILSLNPPELKSRYPWARIYNSN